MASNTRILKVRRRQAAKRAGRDRKKYLAKHGTTPPMAVLFGDIKPEEKSDK